MQKLEGISTRLGRFVLFPMALIIMACALVPFGSRAMRSSMPGTSPSGESLVVDRESSFNSLSPLNATVPTILYFHGNPSDDAGCSGVGNADGILCGGPFLQPKTTLGTLVAAHWNVPDPELNGATDQNNIDPNWIWNLSAPTTIEGDMTVNWWASCGACGQDPFSTADWMIRLWADGLKVFEQRVTNLTPLNTPNLPELLNATVTIPTITANSKLVLHVDPVFLDAQNNTRVYYDSQSPCPDAAGSAPCNSQVIMPVQTGGTPSPTPTPTPNGSPTPTPTPGPSVHSGTLSPSNPTISYVGGPFSVSNPQSTANTPPVCSAATPCDQFALHIAIPPDDPNMYMANATVSWTNSGTTTQGNSVSDFDLYVYKPDAPTGTRIAQSASADNPEAVSFMAVAGDYTVYAIPYDVSPTVQLNGTVSLVRVNGPPSPTPSPTATPIPTAAAMGFSSPMYTATEACTTVAVTILRSGLTNGTTRVDYGVADGSATQRGDFEYAAGSLVFEPGETSKTFDVLLNEDSYFEGSETATITLTNVSGGIVGEPAQATLNVDDNDSGPLASNVIDDAANFVGQHYHDFLDRQADPGGQAYWSNQITGCGDDAQCILSRRIGVSAAFFIEQEFQQTGFYVYRVFKASLGRRPTYLEFMTDWSKLVAGSNLDSEQAAYTEEFVQRSEHAGKYSTASTEASYVDALIQTVRDNSGIDLSSHRSELMSEYDAGRNQADSRARTVRKLVDFDELKQAEYNRAFVLAQYFNYLRREPEEGGYQFWLNVLNNREPNNYRGMVCAFITSREYQERFGSVVTHNNSDCVVP